MRESDIRPEGLLQRYFELSEEDAANCFGNEPRVPIPCVGCASPRVEFDFEKHGFAYGLCQDCGTLYQTPQASLKRLRGFLS